MNTLALLIFPPAPMHDDNFFKELTFYTRYLSEKLKYFITKLSCNYQIYFKGLSLLNLVILQ